MGDEKASGVPPAYVGREDTASVDTIEKSVYSKRLLIVGCVVCIVTGIIVSAIAVPVSKNAVKCDDCEANCQSAAAGAKVNPLEEIVVDKIKNVKQKPKRVAASTVKSKNSVKRDPIANTIYGEVIGHEVNMGTGDEMDNVMSYLGVRFAAPVPRWTRPEEPEILTEPYHADVHRTMCTQGGGILFLSGQQDSWTDFGEDCLFMDIYSPMDDTAGPYPVMLYFYGGAYQGGGTLQYPGQTLVHKGVVVAVINYRLGIFGYATTANGTLKGNYGLWDQVRSMEYVQDTIAAYGGDPNKVTIFGQSAGAGSAGAHIVSPLTKGLFQQALLQSGNELSFWAFNTDLNDQHSYLPQVANNVGCSTEGETEEDWVQCMRDVPESVLLTNNRRFECNFCLGFVPTIDGELVPEHPYEIMMKGEQHDIPIMVGANTGECNLYVMGEWPWMIPEAQGHNRTQHQLEIAELVDWFSFILAAPDVSPEDIYEILNFYYSPWGWLDDKTQNKEIIGQMCTDGAWTSNVAQMLYMRNKKNSSTPLYQYTNGISPLPAFPPIPGWIERGVPHEFEIPFVWGYPYVYSGTEELKNDTYDLHVPIACWSDLDFALTDFMQTLWTNFAKFGNPTPEPIQHPEMAEPVTWEKYNNEDFNYFYMGNYEAGTKPGFRLREAALINEYIFKQARGNFLNPEMVQFIPYDVARGNSPSVESTNHKQEQVKKPAYIPNKDNKFAKMFTEGMQRDNWKQVMSSEYGPVFELVKQGVDKALKEGTITNAADITIQDIIDFITDILENGVDDNVCIQTVGYWYRGVIEDNSELIIQFILDYIRDRVTGIPSLPSLPTLPGGITLPTLRPNHEN